MKADVMGCVSFAVNLRIDLYVRLRDFCFEERKIKKAVIVEALEKMLKKDNVN